MRLPAVDPDQRRSQPAVQAPRTSTSVPRSSRDRPRAAEAPPGARARDTANGWPGRVGLPGCRSSPSTAGELDPGQAGQDPVGEQQDGPQLERSSAGSGDLLLVVAAANPAGHPAVAGDHPDDPGRAGSRRSGARARMAGARRIRGAAAGGQAVREALTNRRSRRRHHDVARGVRPSRAGTAAPRRAHPAQPTSAPKRTSGSDLEILGRLAGISVSPHLLEHLVDDVLRHLRGARNGNRATWSKPSSKPRGLAPPRGSGAG